MQDSLPSLKKATKMLTKALENPNYSYDQYIEILKRRHEIKKLRKNFINYERAQRGFGYVYESDEESTSEIDLSDARSGTDDGVHSEGEQSTEPGES
jgi:hypothetical protein